MLHINYNNIIVITYNEVAICTNIQSSLTMSVLKQELHNGTPIRLKSI